FEESKRPAPGEAGRLIALFGARIRRWLDRRGEPSSARRGALPKCGQSAIDSHGVTGTRFKESAHSIRRYGRLNFGHISLTPIVLAAGPGRPFAPVPKRWSRRSGAGGGRQQESMPHTLSGHAMTYSRGLRACPANAAGASPFPGKVQMSKTA